MTIFEHAMIGINGTLALGLERRCGWPIAALAGLAAVLPDLDGLTILFGLQCYADGHRLWGHNLLVAGIAAVMFSTFAFYTDVFPKSRLWLAKHCKAFSVSDESAAVQSHHPAQLLLWIAVGVAATYSHLFADVIFSAGRNLPIWGVPLFWPFSNAAIAYPLLPWGDIGVTLVLAASMFAMLRWPRRTQAIAIASLVLTAAYIAVRGFVLL